MDPGNSLNTNATALQESCLTLATMSESYPKDYMCCDLLRMAKSKMALAVVVISGDMQWRKTPIGCLLGSEVLQWFLE